MFKFYPNIGIRAPFFREARFTLHIVTSDINSILSKISNFGFLSILSESTQEYKKNYPNDKHFQKFVEKSAVSSFDYLISFSDSLILGSNSIELFVGQLCNFVSSLYINYSEPFRDQFEDIFNVDSNKVVSYENGGFRKHKAFPILFRGGLSVGDKCTFFKENSIQNGKFCDDGYNVFGRTYLNAVRLEHSGKGPRLFCDKSAVDSVQNKRIIRMVNEEKNIFEIVWTIEGLRLDCCGIVKYAKDECNRGEEALEKINSILRTKNLDGYTFQQKSGVSEIVYNGKVKRNRILWFLAERYIILSASAVEKWENGKSRIQCFRTGKL